MIDLSNLTLEELTALENKISDEKAVRLTQKKKAAWKKVLEAVDEYEKAACGYGIIGENKEMDTYSIEFSTTPGECCLFHYA